MWMMINFFFPGRKKSKEWLSRDRNFQISRAEFGESWTQKTIKGAYMRFIPFLNQNIQHYPYEEMYMFYSCHFITISPLMAYTEYKRTWHHLNFSLHGIMHACCLLFHLMTPKYTGCFRVSSQTENLNERPQNM